MPRFAANLSMLYTELAFLDRFAAAARDGFTGVEYLFPYAHTPQAIAEQLQRHGLTQVLFNAPPGDWDAGERGLACLPGREPEFREGIHQALAYAAVLGCPRIHVMAGLLPAGRDANDAQLRHTYIANLQYAAAAAAQQGVQLMIEPINGRDMPGYYLQRQDQAHALVAEIGVAHVQVQMDLYHCQIVEGDVAMKLRHYLPTGRVGHIQVAGVPDRHEPDIGELHHPYLFALLDQLGYSGWVGCEYRPRAGTTQGLGWLHAARASCAAGLDS
ncbi:2-oxo-tetronate isomerase [Comamonas sp. GB3 AK4-5]|uniref:2-oxo-tetronate isomerase n=1 Tax=Comamonas sp. GB3 AK4-5 TaxID=3231487 RepID=UPI00351EC8E6